MGAHVAAITVFVCCIILVSVIGFAAARFRRGDLHTLEEWGLAGRGFGTLLSWFLIGGDLYTAYTFIAVPALVFGAGAIGFFGVPYTILIYPMAFALMPRLWTICRRHGYLTTADWVHGRFGNRWLALAVAVTGMIATMPYIALQLIGMRVVIAGFGFPTQGLLGQLPLLAAFVFLAGYTYTSGLRAPAMIAIVKDVLMYAVIIAAVAVIPGKLGGYAHVFSALPSKQLILTAADAHGANGISAYLTLALGSAAALLLYPHSFTAMMSARDARTIKRNAALLPAYSLLLGFLSLMGVMALSAHVDRMPAFAPYFAQYHATFAVPALILAMFPDWFAGLAFAAIVIGALVPAAVMSIAAGNLFTRNIYRIFIRPDADDTAQTRVAKRAALAIKLGSLVFIFALPQAYAVDLQLLGGVWIIQTLPAIVFGLSSNRRFTAPGLLAGWIAGMASGSIAAATQAFRPIVPLHLAGYTLPCYAAVMSLAINIMIAAVASAWPVRRADAPVYAPE